MSQKNQPGSNAGSQAERAERLAQQLRANLRKRKAQARSGREQEKPES